METKKQYLKFYGVALFPKEEDGKRTWCIALNDDTVNEIEKACEKANPNLDGVSINTVEYNEVERSCINVKSSFDFPVYDKKGNEIEEEMPILHGAKCLISICIKEYTFKKKKGLTAYINGAVVFEQGEPLGMTFGSMMDGFDKFDESELPF